MLKPSQYKHIIWDWNGTLLNDAWLFVDIMNSVLDNRNMDTITIEKYRKIFRFPVEDYYNKLGFDLGKESFKKSGLEFIKAYKKRRYEAELHPGVRSLLSKLLSINIQHSILSAQHQTLLDDLVQYYNIGKYFIGINGLNDYYAHSKIDKGIEWMEKTGLNSKQVLFIGDTDHDFEVAQALGADCLLLSHGHYCHSRLIQTGAPVIRELEDIFHIFTIDMNPAETSCN
jgi:phosphoglycolate phosphatase